MGTATGGGVFEGGFGARLIHVGFSYPRGSVGGEEGRGDWVLGSGSVSNRTMTWLSHQTTERSMSAKAFAVLDHSGVFSRGFEEQMEREIAQPSAAPL